MHILLVALLTAQVNPDDLLDRGGRRGRAQSFEGIDLAFQARSIFWWPNINSKFRAEEAGDGTAISLDNDLHVEDEVPFGFLEFGLVRREPGQKAWIEFVRAFFWEHEWSGVTTLDRREEFNGMTFNAGDRVSSLYSIWELGIEGGGPVSPPDEPMLSTMIGGIRIVEVSASMTGTAGSVDERIRLLYLGGTASFRWQEDIYTAGMSLGFFYSGWNNIFGDFHYNESTGRYERSSSGWNAVLLESSASFGFESGRVTLQLGLKLDMNALRSRRVKPTHDVQETNSFSWLIGGPFAEITFRF